MSITVCTKRDEARHFVFGAKRSGNKVGVVPTMGALHQGHLSLVRASTAECQTTVVTVFVNPTQFGPDEDFEQYPRDLEKDLALLSDLRVDMIFAPMPDEIYSHNHSTYVSPPKVAVPLEGELRPGHFQGVATIVLKLFQIIPADVAFFGQKDYQQTRVIKDMVADLDLPISIQVCPTVRDSDGLALSSRNAYLSHDERTQALGLSQALKLAVQSYRNGHTVAEEVRVAMHQCLADAGIERIDYVALVDGASLQPVEHLASGNMALIAAYSGDTRLIDNVRIS